MPTATAEYDVLSELDTNGDPHFADCELVLGDVTLKFKNGRAKVSETLAPTVAGVARLSIPGYRGPVAPAVPNRVAQLPASALEHQIQRAGRSEEEKAEALALAREHLQAEGVDLGDDLANENAELKQRLADMEALLERMAGEATILESPSEGTESPSEGEGESPEAPEIPTGFAAQTTDGHPRCWARKGDGTQCSNPAADDTHACKLSAHKKLLGV